MVMVPCVRPQSCGVTEHAVGSAAHTACSAHSTAAAGKARGRVSALPPVPERTHSPAMDRVRVHVPEGTVADGERAYGITAPDGAPVRGTGIAYDDERIPEAVYHVTTQRDAVRASGMLLAGGAGGLGGDGRDRIVSLTVSRSIAEDIGEQLRLVSGLASAYDEHADDRGAVNTALAGALGAEADRAGWSFTYVQRLRDVPFMRDSYGFRDVVDQYYAERETQTGQPNPLFFSSLNEVRSVDPTQVEVISIPRDNLNNGAQITDFDLGRGGLEEIRSYGDVPL